jgi:hypothetical protein
MIGASLAETNERTKSQQRPGQQEIRVASFATYCRVVYHNERNEEETKMKGGNENKKQLENRFCTAPKSP